MRFASGKLYHLLLVVFCKSHNLFELVWELLRFFDQPFMFQRNFLNLLIFGSKFSLFWYQIILKWLNLSLWVLVLDSVLLHLLNLSLNYNLAIWLLDIERFSVGQGLDSELSIISFSFFKSLRKLLPLRFNSGIFSLKRVEFIWKLDNLILEKFYFLLFLDEPVFKLCSFICEVFVRFSGIIVRQLQLLFKFFNLGLNALNHLRFDLKFFLLRFLRLCYLVLLFLNFLKKFGFFLNFSFS